MDALTTLGSFFDTLLGLRDVSWADPRLSVALGRPLPGWAWVLAVAAGAWLSAWAYHRLLGARPVRLALAGLRFVTLMLIVLLLCDPRLVRTDERIEPDVLMVLVDRSASMAVSDLRADDGSAVSRSQAVADALAPLMRADEPDDADDADAAEADRSVRWLGFDGTVFGLDPGTLADAPTGGSTALASAAQRAAALSGGSGGRPVAGVLLISDGRSPEPVEPAARRLAGLGVPVFAVPVGAERPPLDLSVERVDAPRRAFAGDVVPASVVVRRTGGDDDGTPLRVRVTLTDRAAGVALDERKVELTRDATTVRLRTRAARPGVADWDVTVAPLDDAGELDPDNNARPLRVEVIDRPLRVLYVDGVPRWEYRYLKNLLVRERSIDSSVLLLSADASFAQEGDTPITRLPEGDEEWRDFDVLVLGDVPANYFSESQWASVRRAVSDRGMGLLWIGGPASTPTGFANTSAADLLPMTRPDAVTRWGVGEVALRGTALAEALNVLQPDDALPDESAGASGGGDAWDGVRWVQQVGRLKPAAEVLAEAVVVAPGGATEDRAESTAAVVRMRYGAGQVVYVATDETWRFRRGVGERYQERFWVPILRMLGRGSAAAGDGRARLSAAGGGRVQRGVSVPVELVVDDAALLPEGTGVVRVRAERLDEEGQPIANEPAQDIELTVEPTAPGDAAGVTRRLSGRWSADRPGRYRLTPADPLLAGTGAAVEVEVIAPDDERRQVAADHAKLARFAEMTGGRVVPLEEVGDLLAPGGVRSVARRIADDVSEPLWHSPLALALLLGLLALEWAVRRWMRLA